MHYRCPTARSPRTSPLTSRISTTPARSRRRCRAGKGCSTERLPDAARRTSGSSSARSGSIFASRHRRTARPFSPSADRHVTVSRLRGVPGIGVDRMGDAADSAADPDLLRLENLDTDLRPLPAAVEAHRARGQPTTMRTATSPSPAHGGCAAPLASPRRSGWKREIGWRSDADHGRRGPTGFSMSCSRCSNRATRWF